MGDHSTIEWTEATWNPTLGCSRVSPGCDNCYAERLAVRQAHNPDYVDVLTAGRKWTGTVNMIASRLDQPLRWRRPRRIFVDSMSDLFHERVADQFIAEVFVTMALASHHTYQVLTKRPQRMARLLGDGERWLGLLDEAMQRRRGCMFAQIISASWYPMPWVWLGVSIENDSYCFRADHLAATPAAVRFLSIEPLLGPVRRLNLNGIDWVIVGGESGPDARPMHPDWARAARNTCVTRGIPFFFKQWGGWAPLGPLYDQTDNWDQEADDARMEAAVLEVDGTAIVELERDGTIVDGYQPADRRTWLMAKVGKKPAGRVLDGREWNETPREPRRPEQEGLEV